MDDRNILCMDMTDGNENLT